MASASSRANHCQESSVHIKTSVLETQPFLPFSQAYSAPIRTPCLSPRSIMSFHLNQGLVDSPLTWSIKAFGRDMNGAGYVAKINAVAFSPATSNFPSAKAMSPSMEDRAWEH